MCLGEKGGCLCFCMTELVWSGAKPTDQFIELQAFWPSYLFTFNQEMPVWFPSQVIHEKCDREAPGSGTVLSSHHHIRISFPMRFANIQTFWTQASHATSLEACIEIFVLESQQ